MAYCQTPVLGLGQGAYFTFAWDNNNKNYRNGGIRQSGISKSLAEYEYERQEPEN